MRPAVVVGLVLLCLAAPVASAIAPYAGAKDVVRPLNLGDSTSISRMEIAGTLGSSVSAFASAAARYDRRVAEKALLECRQAAELAKSPTEAVSCGFMLAGLYESRGDARQWAQAWRWIGTSGLPLFTGKHGSGSIGDGFDAVDFQALTDLPAPTFTFHRPTAQLLRARPGDRRDDSRPYVEITLNGRPVRALVDTGVASTLLIPAALADELGLEPIAAGLTMIKQASAVDRSEVIKGREAYYVTDVSIGNLSAKNLLVLGTERPLDTVIVGHGLLAQFAGLEIDAKLVSLRAPGRHGRSCRRPVALRYLPTQRFNGQIALPAELDGQTARLGLDTGADATLVIVGHAARAWAHAPASEVEVNAAGMTSRLLVGTTPLRLSLGDIQDASLTAQVVQGPLTNIDAILGAGIIESKGVGIGIDFEKMEACFN